MSDKVWQNTAHEETRNKKCAPTVFPVADLSGDQLHSEWRHQTTSYNI